MIFSCFENVLIIIYYFPYMISHCRAWKTKYDSCVWD